MTDQSKTPGPGSYNGKYFGNFHGNAIIGTAPRISAELIEETPGPGNYIKNYSSINNGGNIAHTGRYDNINS